MPSFFIYTALGPKDFYTFFLLKNQSLQLGLWKSFALSQYQHCSRDHWRSGQSQVPLPDPQKSASSCQGGPALPVMGSCLSGCFLNHILLGYSFFSNIYEFTPHHWCCNNAIPIVLNAPSDHMGWSRFGSGIILESLRLCGRGHFSVGRFCIFSIPIKDSKKVEESRPAWVIFCFS